MGLGNTSFVVLLLQVTIRVQLHPELAALCEHA